MQEAAAAREALARVLAIDHAVEIGEIFGAVAFAGAGAAELAGIGERVLHALGRRRMAGEKVERARIGAAAGRLDIGIALHVGEEARGAERIEAGARGNADADAVGLEFLRAREARQRQLRLGERQRAGLRIAEHVVDHVADDGGLLGLFLADRGVARDHVSHLVRQHRGELGLVVGERDQSARDVELAVRQREGIDRRRVEDGHLVFEVRPFGRRHQAVDGLFDLRLQARVLVDAAIGGENARVLALRRRLRLRLRGGLRHRQRDLAVVGRAGAGREQQSERNAAPRARFADPRVGVAAMAARDCLILRIRSARAPRPR